MDVIPRRRRKVGQWLPEVRGWGRHRTGRRNRVARIPMDLAVKRGNPVLAMLLEAQVEGGDRVAGVADVIDDDPAVEHVATVRTSAPIEPAAARVVERPAQQISVVARLE